MENLENVGKPKRKRTEVLVIILIVIAAVMVIGIRFHMSSKAEKENALMSELRAARTSVQLYMTLNKATPPSLSALVEQRYKLGEKEGAYLSGLRLDKQGNVVDAFGNRMGYDPKTGRIWSTTKNYESW